MDIKKYQEAMKRLPIKDKYSKEDLFKDELLITKQDKLRIYYAPFDYINQKAKVVLVGITPSLTQMHNSYHYFIHHYKNEPFDEVLKNAKKAASFSGPMRKNLIEMLDEIKLNQVLQIHSCQALFEDKNDVVHNTSLLRYPVFINDNNYTGSSPKILKHEVLKNQLETIFVKEFYNLDQNVVIIPMGKAVSEVLRYLNQTNQLTQSHILFDFPHPSGANVNRKKYLEDKKEDFINVLRNINL